MEAGPGGPRRRRLHGRKKFLGVGFKEDRFWGGSGGGREWVVLVMENENWEVSLDFDGF